MILKAKAPAKVNLFLHVIGKRADGYHLLESLFAPLENLYDEITVEKNSQVITEYTSDKIHNDIISKTANLLKDKFAINDGAKFTISKNIPISAGLGGGSSNAATAMKLLNKLWKLDLSTQDMVNIGSSIGADVPFFIDARPSFVEGIGEIITPHLLNKKYYILLVNPMVPCSTKKIFGMGFDRFDVKLIDRDNLGINNLNNSLTSNAIKLHSEIHEVLNFLETQNNIYLARMSGSGSTCFGLFESEKDMLSAKTKTPKHWWTHSQELIL